MNYVLLNKHTICLYLKTFSLPFKWHQEIQLISGILLHLSGVLHYCATSFDGPCYITESFTKCTISPYANTVYIAWKFNGKMICQFTWDDGRLPHMIRDGITFACQVVRQFCLIEHFHLEWLTYSNLSVPLLWKALWLQNCSLLDHCPMCLW